MGLFISHRGCIDMSLNNLLSDIFLDSSVASPATMDFIMIKRFFLDLLKQIHESIIIIDTHTRICFVNDSYLEMFNVKPENILGRHLKDFEPLARIRDVLQTQQPCVGDISYIHSAKINVIADIIPLFHERVLIGALALMKNVTELIDSQKELEHFKQLTQYLREERYSREHLPDAFQHVYGQSSSMVKMLQVAAKASKSASNICIFGESGTGKEVLTDAIHAASQYANGPLVKVNCAAIPESLMESELFGYETGAFTGARVGGKTGKFELAAGGTLFLDEIGEMPISMQVKLLRALQEREISRVGGEKIIKLNFRLITATNRDLESMVKEGKFREDLYYRINVINLHIPPLRERREDIMLYSHLFLEELSRTHGVSYQLTPAAIIALNSYAWPGNVRELRNCIERAVVLSPDEKIDTEYLPDAIIKNISPNDNSLPDTSITPRSFLLRELLEKTERETIITVLQLTENNRTEAIRRLGISRRAFYQKLEKYGLCDYLL